MRTPMGIHLASIPTPGSTPHRSQDQASALPEEEGLHEVSVTPVQEAQGLLEIKP